MENVGVKENLQALLRHPAIWRGAALSEVAVPSLPTGYGALDALLPGGGWPGDALVEILAERPGIGELQLLLPSLARLAEERPVVWVAPPHVPYAPALRQAGVDLAHVWVAEPAEASDALWAAEQALRSGVCGTVLLWAAALGDAELRRLQMAADSGRCCGFLFRDAGYARQSSPAALRLLLAPQSDGLAVEILKRRGGGPARLMLNRKHGHAVARVVPAAISPGSRVAGMG